MLDCGSLNLARK